MIFKTMQVSLYALNTANQAAIQFNFDPMRMKVARGKDSLDSP
jgi:hypothetical protein